MRSACQDYGFFQLIGYGIPFSLQREVLRCTERLFDLPLNEKDAMTMSRSIGLSKRGYEAVGGQKLGEKPDTKKGFYVGVEVPPEDPGAGTFLRGPNLWLQSLEDQEFTNTITEYHVKVLKLHKTLLDLLI
jgi:isopenicillin N synthase-like dioxygenase